MQDIKQFLTRPEVPKLLSIGLFLGVLLQCVKGTLAIGSLNHLDSTSTSSPVVNKSQSQPLNINSILKTPLFGDYVPNNLNEIRKSRLDIKVVGILLATREEESTVILQTAGGHEQAYQVGNSIPGGGMIKRITNEGVLIRRDGALESLSLPKNELIFERTPIKY